MKGKTMNALRQQIVHERVERIARNLHVTEDLAFIRLAHSLITGMSLHSFDPADLVDGGQDKGIDTITIAPDDNKVTVYIMQIKYTTSFPSNSLVLLRNGLDWVNNRSRVEVDGLTNAPLKDRINDYRSYRSSEGPSNIRFVVAMVTNGSSKEVSIEYQQEAKIMTEQYDNGTFASFEFQTWGCDEFVNRMNEIEKKDKRLDADIEIRYDRNIPSMLLYSSEGLKAVVCTASASEIARIVNTDESGSVFDKNIRQFLGTRGAVNTDIRDSCTKMDASHLFWFLNNGITIVCDSFDPVQDQDNPVIKVRNMQIVNGCQTATTLAQAAQDQKLAHDVRILLRIYQTTNPQLIDKIVLTTNNQNKINARDLRANDDVQVDMQAGFQRYGYSYERKTHQYDNVADIDNSRVIVNEEAGQAYLAIVLRKPSDARRRKYKVWGEDYDRIFGGQIIEPHILTTLIYICTKYWLLTSGLTRDSDDTRRKLANNAAFHVARIAAYMWRGNDKWDISPAILESEINQIENNSHVLAPYLRDAFDHLERIITDNPQYSKDIDTALKSNALDSEIDQSLYGDIGRKSRTIGLWDN